MQEKDGLLERLIERNLATSAVATADKESARHLLEKSSLYLGVGPQLRKGDLVLVYFPAKLAKTLGGPWGLRFALAAEADSSSPGSEFQWNQMASLRDKVELERPIGPEMRDHPVLGEWRMARVNFRDAGSRDEFVPEPVKQALWQLLLERNPGAREGLESMLESNPMDAVPEWSLFGSGGRAALARANGLRAALSSSKVHTSHLLVAAYDLAEETVRQVFAEANLNRERLVSEIAELSEPATYADLDEGTTPVMSGHAARALRKAGSLAAEGGSSQIEVIHIWHGLMALGDGCSKIAKLPPVTLPPITVEEFLVGTRALRDTWTDDDLLDYSGYSQALADPILFGHTQPPLTIGIQAPWGHGKTSLMRMIQKRLDPGSFARERARRRPPARKAQATFTHLMDWLDPDPPKGKPAKSGPADQTPLDAGLDDDYKGFFRKANGQPRRRGLLPIVEKDPKTGKLRPRVPTVWFNPLYYQEKEQVWAGMAHAMLHQLAAQVEKPLTREGFWAQLQASRISADAMRRELRQLVLVKLVPRLLYWALAGAGLAFVLLLIPKIPAAVGLGLGALTSLLAAVIDKVVTKREAAQESLSELGRSFEACVREPDYESKLGFLWLVDQDMDRALELLVGDFPVAVFIDDLDRCDPEVVNKLILAVNQFLSLRYRNTIFFLGMDMEMVAASLEEVRSEVFKEELAKLTGRKSFGWAFMDKFVQVPFFIPRMDPGQASGYLTEILDLGSPAPEGPAAAAKPGAADPAATPEAEFDEDLKEIQGSASVDGLSKAIATKSKKKLTREQSEQLREVSSARTTELMRDPRGDEIQRLVALAVQDVDLNPRAMKRLLNLVRLLRNVQVARGEGGSGDYDRKLVVRSAHLLIGWPRVIRWLQGLQDEDEGKSPTIEALEKAVAKTKTAEEWQETGHKKAAGNEAAGNEAEESLLADPALYELVKRIGEDPPGLSEIFAARLF